MKKIAIFFLCFTLFQGTIFGKNETKDKKKSKEEKRKIRAHKHDNFFLSVSYGMGFSNVDIVESEPSPETGEYIETTYKLKPGTLFSLGVKLGWEISPNLILHSTLGVDDTGASKGEILNSSGSLEVDYTEINNKVIFGYLSIKPGLTYYFMPINIFVSANIGYAFYMGAGSLNETRFKQGGSYIQTGDFFPDSSEDTDGIAMEFNVGKEWWIGKNWALGLSLLYIRASGNLSKSFEEKEISYDANSFGLRANITFD